MAEQAGPAAGAEHSGAVGGSERIGAPVSGDRLPGVMATAPSQVRLQPETFRRLRAEAARREEDVDSCAELWTLDGPLARNASSRGLKVNLIDSQS
jgi:hypothetical protein